MTAFHETEQWRVDWNTAARDAAGMTDEELIDHISRYEKLILEFKIKKEATETEAEKRNIRKPKFKLDRSGVMDSDTAYMVEKRKDKDQASKLDKAFMKLKAMGLSDEKARASLASMSRETEARKAKS